MILIVVLVVSIRVVIGLSSIVVIVVII